MSKKVLAILGLAAVIALSAGVIGIVGNSGDKEKDIDPTVADFTEAPVETTEAPTSPTEAPTQPATLGGGDSLGYGKSLIAAGKLRIVRVVDHSTGSETTAREVFGRYYTECFLTFPSDSRFQLCINPTSGDVITGSYKIYGSVISAQYSSGTGSEFNVKLKDGSATIDYIIVNYGNYDVYFG